MSTDYITIPQVRFADLFDGRLEKHGVREKIRDAIPPRPIATSRAATLFSPPRARKAATAFSGVKSGKCTTIDSTTALLPCLRGEQHDLDRDSLEMAQAKIAKDLIAGDRSLADSERRYELLKAARDIWAARHTAAKVVVSDQGRRAFHIILGPEETPRS